MAMNAPHPEEQRHDRRAWAEGWEAANKLPQGHLTQVVIAQKKEAESATRDWRRQGAEYWDLWENKVDLSDKEDWQAQVWVPKPYTTIEQATGLVQRGLVDSPDFWGIEGQEERDKGLAQTFWRPLLKLLVDDSHYAWKFLDASKCGFITGLAGYLKFRWQTTAVPVLQGMTVDPETGQPQPTYGQKLRSFLAVDWVNPAKIYRDPDSAPRENFSGTYLYHSEWKDRSAIRAMQQSGWNKDAIDELLADTAARTGSATNPAMTDSDRQAQERQHLRWERSRFRMQYLLDEGWLDIPDENGDVIFPDALMVHSSGRIIYGPVPNPLWAVDLQTGRRKWPFIAGAPIVHPERFEGRGLIEQIQDLSWIYSNLFMLFSDGLNWVVNQPTEVQQDALTDTDDLAHYPGKLWIRRGATPALTPAQTGKMDVGAVLLAIQYVEQVMQNSSFVTDMAIGLPGSRSNVTKGEVEIKTAQSLSIFEAIGRNLELVGRESVELIYNLALQYCPADLAVRVLGQRAAPLLQMGLPERMEALQGNFDFSFTGVTQSLQKSEQLGRLGQFAKIASVGPYLQTLMTQPQVFAEILSAYVDTLGLRDRIHLPDVQAQVAGVMPTALMRAAGVTGAAGPGGPGGDMDAELAALVGGGGVR